jgi:hypothetical protein
VGEPEGGVFLPGRGIPYTSELNPTPVTGSDGTSRRWPGHTSRVKKEILGT